MQPYEQLSARGQIGRLRTMARTALHAYAIRDARLVALRHEHNTTFRVTTAADEHYVLRLNRPSHHSPRAVRSEMRWLEALSRETTLGVPAPVATRDGALMTIIEAAGVPEPRSCVLLRWQAGRFLDAGLRPAHLERVGELTAELHLHAAAWPPPEDFARSRVDTLTREVRYATLYPSPRSFASAAEFPSAEDAERAIELTAALCSPADGALVAETIDRVRQALRELGDSLEHFGLIHADLHQENYFFHRGRVRAIDFDDCGFGHHLYDLGVTLIELQHLPQYPALRSALLAGYRRLKPLPAAHELYLDRFFALRRLQLLMWVLESRAHPAFAEWRAWSHELLSELKATPTASTD